MKVIVCSEVLTQISSHFAWTSKPPAYCIVFLQSSSISFNILKHLLVIFYSIALIVPVMSIHPIQISAPRCLLESALRKDPLKTPSKQAFDHIMYYSKSSSLSSSLSESKLYFFRWILIFPVSPFFFDCSLSIRSNISINFPSVILESICPCNAMLAIIASTADARSLFTSYVAHNAKQN